jgi:hypothetical protein
VGIVESKIVLGLLCFLRGDLGQAQALAEEGLGMAREIGFSGTLAHALAFQSLVTAVAGDAALSRQLGNEALAICSTFIGNVLALSGLSIANSRLRQYSLGCEQVRKATSLAHPLPLPALITWLLPVAAQIAAQRGDAVVALKLLSFAENHPLNLTGWMNRWDALATLRDQLCSNLSRQAFDAAWKRGKELDPNDLMVLLRASG